MPPSQMSLASLLALVPSKRSSWLLTPSVTSPQQQQQQQQTVSHALGLAKPFRPILTDQSPTDPLKDTNRHLAAHTMGHANIDFSLQQGPVGAAMPAAAPLLPLLDAADFVNEPACFQVGSSGGSLNNAAAPLYTSCFQHYENEASDDFAVHRYQVAPSALDFQQPPNCNLDQASLLVPFEANDSCCQRPLPHPMVHSLHSIQVLHCDSSQHPSSHDHAVSFGTQQTVPQASFDASLQHASNAVQMSHDVHRPHVPHTPHDGCHDGQVHDDQPFTTALHMPVQLVRSTDAPDGEEQESTQADVAAIGAAAEGLNEGVWPRCHSSISTGSR